MEHPVHNKSAIPAQEQCRESNGKSTVFSGAVHLIGRIFHQFSMVGIPTLWVGISTLWVGYSTLWVEYYHPLGGNFHPVGGIFYPMGGIFPPFGWEY